MHNRYVFLFTNPSKWQIASDNEIEEITTFKCTLFDFVFDAKL